MKDHIGSTMSNSVSFADSSAIIERETSHFRTTVCNTEK